MPHRLLQGTQTGFTLGSGPLVPLRYAKRLTPPCRRSWAMPLSSLPVGLHQLPLIAACPASAPGARPKLKADPCGGLDKVRFDLYRPTSGPDEWAGGTQRPAADWRSTPDHDHFPRPDNRVLAGTPRPSIDWVHTSRHLASRDHGSRHQAPQGRTCPRVPQKTRELEAAHPIRQTTTLTRGALDPRTPMLRHPEMAGGANGRPALLAGRQTRQQVDNDLRA